MPWGLMSVHSPPPPGEVAWVLGEDEEGNDVRRVRGTGGMGKVEKRGMCVYM